MLLNPSGHRNMILLIKSCDLNPVQLGPIIPAVLYALVRIIMDTSARALGEKSPELVIQIFSMSQKETCKMNDPI